MRTLAVTFVNANCAEFQGYGSRELYTQVAGRPPVFNTRSRRWVTVPDKARDLVALAEARGYTVTVTGTSRSATDRDVHRGDDLVGHDLPDPGRGLW